MIYIRFNFSCDWLYQIVATRDGLFYCENPKNRIQVIVLRAHTIMTSSKLKPSFGIDDILYQSPTSSNSIFSKHSDRSAGKSDMDAVGSTTSSHDSSAKLPKHPVPMFPSTMFDFNPAKYYLPHLPMNVHQRFPPSTSYLEQYANALQKGE